MPDDILLSDGASAGNGENGRGREKTLSQKIIGDAAQQKAYSGKINGKPSRGYAFVYLLPTVEEKRREVVFLGEIYR